MNVTAETMTLMKEALSSQRPDLQKAVTTSTGLAFYDLQSPAKNLYPTVTKLRNMTPRVGRPSGYGTAAHWKQVTAVTGSGYDAMGWIPEGQRSAAMSYTVSHKSATYVTLGEEDYLTFEAESAGQGFEDLNATVSLRLLQKTMRKEETGLRGGNTPAQFSQLLREVLRSATAQARSSQIVREVLRSAAGTVRTSQISREILRSFAPTALGQLVREALRSAQAPVATGQLTREVLRSSTAITSVSQLVREALYGTGSSTDDVVVTMLF